MFRRVSTSCSRLLFPFQIFILIIFIISYIEPTMHARMPALSISLMSSFGQNFEASTIPTCFLRSIFSLFKLARFVENNRCNHGGF